GSYLGVEVAVVFHAPALYAAFGGFAAFVGLFGAPAEFVVGTWTSHCVPAFLNFEAGSLAKGAGVQRRWLGGDGVFIFFDFQCAARVPAAGNSWRPRVSAGRLGKLKREISVDRV